MATRIGDLDGADQIVAATWIADLFDATENPDEIRFTVGPGAGCVTVVYTGVGAEWCERLKRVAREA